jgi:uncharacterized membrane protein
MSEQGRPSKIVALVFDDPYKADEVRAALLRMEGEGLLDIAETAVLSKKDAKNIRITQDANPVQTGKNIGRLVGSIAGMVLPIPFVLPLLGPQAGSFLANLTDKGIKNKFVKELQKELQPGTSILILLASAERPGRAAVVERVKQWNPRILQSELLPEVLREIEAALGDA